MSRTGMKRIQLRVVYEDVAALRDDHVLCSELLLEADCAGACPDTHGSNDVESHKRILGAAPDGHRPGLQLRSINGQRGLVDDVGVNDAEIKGERQRPSRF